jgi:hypothetical protein
VPVSVLPPARALPVENELASDERDVLLSRAFESAVLKLAEGIATITCRVESTILALERQRCDQEALDSQIRAVLACNHVLDRMMRTMIAATHTIPSLAIILPEVFFSWWNPFHPTRLLYHHYRLYFLCSFTGQIVPCGPEGKGYKIKATKQWVQDAAPVLRVGLVLVQAALVASGLPVPVADLFNALGGTAKQNKYMGVALHLLTHPPEDNQAGHTALRTVRASTVGGVPHGESAVNHTHTYSKAYGAIKQVLTGQNIALTCGLRQVTCSRTGTTAWVLDNDATERAWRESLIV